MQLEEHLVGFLHKDIGLSYQVFVPATDSNLTKRSTVVRRKLGNSEGTTWSERCEAGSGGGGHTLRKGNCAGIRIQCADFAERSEAGIY